jgi:hypothetical protein
VRKEEFSISAVKGRDSNKHFNNLMPHGIEKEKKKGQQIQEDSIDRIELMELVEPYELVAFVINKRLPVSVHRTVAASWISRGYPT